MRTKATALKKVEPTWEPGRVRQEVGNLISEYKLAFWFLLKDHPELVADVQKPLYAHFTELIKRSGVKTPLDLVTYLAELTVNLIGGEVLVEGDDKCASITYEQLPTWDSMKGRIDLSAAGRSQLLILANASLQRFADGFGFQSEVEAKLDHPIMKVTFRTEQ